MGVVTTNARFCGRYFSAVAAGVVGDATVCSRQRPFMLGVHTDSFEGAQDMGAGGTGAGAAAAKYGMAPLGTIGFSLGYQLVACQRLRFVSNHSNHFNELYIFVCCFRIELSNKSIAN